MTHESSESRRFSLSYGISQKVRVKVNRQRPTSVMRRPELKLLTLAKWHISPLVGVVIKPVKSTLCSRPTAILIFIIKHEFLYNNSCKPVFKLLSVFSKVQNISKTLNNSGRRIIQLVWGGLAHQLAKYGANLLARFV